METAATVYLKGCAFTSNSPNDVYIGVGTLAVMSSCPGGAHNAGTGTLKCDGCDYSYPANLQGICSSCPAGMFQPSAGAIACSTCAPGTYAVAPGALPIPTKKPTGPSPAPSTAPSSLPTSQPTSRPTNFVCTSPLRFANPEVIVASGTAYSLGSVATVPSTNGLFSRSFGGFFAAPPGSSFTFGVYLAGKQVGSSGGGGTTLQASASGGFISVLVQHSIVYYDALSASLAYLLTDAAGRVQVLPASLSVQMALVSSGNTATVTCGNPGASTGMGYCTTTMSSAWFSTTADTSVSATVQVLYSGVAVLSSAEHTFTLRKRPTFASLSTASMVAAVPLHPLLVGSTYSASITANTNGQALSVWVMSVTYDTTLLTYVSTATSSSYTAAVVTATSGRLSLSTSGLASGVSASTVTGSNVAVVTLKFKVASGATVGVHNNALSFVVTQMVNPYSIAFANNVAGQVNDQRGGAMANAELTVFVLSYVGVFAFAVQNELVNTAPLTGGAVTSTISTYGVYNNAAYTNAAVSGVCTLADSSSSTVLEVSSGCMVSVTSAHSAGSAAVSVIVSYGSIASTAVSFRVWFPSSITTSAAGTTLRAVGTTACRVFQQSQLSAMANFTAGADTVTADVTSLVNWSSSNIAVVAIGTAGKAQVVAVGIEAGSATISVTTPNLVHPGITVSAPIAVTVTSAVVAVTSLQVIVYSGAIWVSSAGSVVSASSILAQVQLLHSLKSEGNTANVVVYAIFADGTKQDVTSQVTLTSTEPSNIAIASASSIVVPVGSLPIFHNFTTLSNLHRSTDIR
jgi:hypothetical protein